MALGPNELHFKWALGPNELHFKWALGPYELHFKWALGPLSPKVTKTALKRECVKQYLCSLICLLRINTHNFIFYQFSLTPFTFKAEDERQFFDTNCQ
jgi:hypothetical protein